MTSGEIEARVVSRMSAGGRPAALEELALILKADPRNEAALHLRAKYHAMADEWQPVIENLTAVLAINPSARFKGMLGFAYKSSGDPRSALAEYDREISLDPDEWSLFQNRGRVRNSMGDAAGAKDDLTAAARKAGLSAAWNELADIEAASGNGEAALHALDEAVKLEPTWLNYLNRGALKFKIKLYDAAALDLDVALFELMGREDNLPMRQQAFLYRGWCAYMLGKEDPMEFVEEAVSLKPDDPEALTLRGGIYSTRDHAKAMADLNEAIRLDPEQAMAYSYRGNVHLKLGDKKAALSDYRKAIELDPIFSEVLKDRLKEAGA